MKYSFLAEMWKALLFIIFAVVGADLQNDPAANQLVDFKENTMGPIGILTTDAGAPVVYEDAESTFNTNLLSNEHFVDAMTHFVRERIPERVVHAPGTGAFGYFEVTHDISHICKAKLFSEVGKRTPVAVRFSMGFSSIGVRDTFRDLRGFSIKFYTEEGNLDLIGLNTPVASTNEPLAFTNAVHAAKRNPATNLPDSNMLWDILTLRTEVIFLFLYILSDYGMSDGYRHMSGFPVHTMDVYNEDGKKSFVRFHFVPEAGVKNLNATEVIKLATGDPDYFARDLYNAIANSNYPSWLLKIQILTEEDVKKSDFDVYDVTKLLPIDMYPLHTVGRIILNKNPLNHFASIEQLAFAPGNLVPGIRGSAGKAFESRRFVYREAQIYRLGINFKKIPVNCPMGIPANTYNRDGVSPVNGNGKNGPNYYPNSFNGAIASVEKNRPELSKIFEKRTDNFKQASDFYSKDLTSSERTTLVENLVQSICPCASTIKKRAIRCLKKINLDLGTRVAKGLAANC